MDDHAPDAIAPRQAVRLLKPSDRDLAHERIDRRRAKLRKRRVQYAARRPDRLDFRAYGSVPRKERGLIHVGGGAKLADLQPRAKARRRLDRVLGDGGDIQPCCRKHGSLLILFARFAGRHENGRCAHGQRKRAAALWKARLLSGRTKRYSAENLEMDE